MTETIWQRIKELEELRNTYTGELALTVTVYNDNGAFLPKELIGAKFNDEQQIRNMVKSLNDAGHGIVRMMIHYHFFVERAEAV